MIDILTKHADRLLNIGLHGTNLGIRFVLVFVLAKYLDPASVGYYGLFVAAVGYSIYFVGLDFYTYVTREILKTPNERRGLLLKGQVVLSGCLYLLFLPFAIVLLQHSGWPEYLFYWFFPILVLEHFNQELSRLLVALSKPVAASIVLFSRQGSWALVLVALFFWDPASRQLQTVMALWVGAGVAAAWVGVRTLRQLEMGGWRIAVDWRWIRSGIAVSFAFLVATLALRGIQTFDRYWLEALGGVEIVGAYVLYFGVASALLGFLDAGVFAFSYPELIKLHHSRDAAKARLVIKRMLMYTFLFSTVFSIVSWLLIPILLSWIDRPVYSNSVEIFPWLMLAMVIHAFGMVPHYGLYAKSRDMPIILSHLIGLATFVLFAWALSSRLSVLAVPVGLMASFVVILTWKTLAYLRLDEPDDPSQAQPQSA